MSQEAESEENPTGGRARMLVYWCDDMDKIRNLRIADPKGRQISLEQLAELRVEEGPAQISREAIHRRITIECNVRGRDLASSPEV